MHLNKRQCVAGRLCTRACVSALLLGSQLQCTFLTAHFKCVMRMTRFLNLSRYLRKIIKIYFKNHHKHFPTPSNPSSPFLKKKCLCHLPGKEQGKTENQQRTKERREGNSCLASLKREGKQMTGRKVSK